MKRNKQFVLRLDKKQMDKLNHDVSLTSLSREEYVRCLISGYRPNVQPSKEFFDVISKLRAIGNNLNQIANVANRSGYVDTEQYREETTHLRKEILGIRKIVCEPVKMEDGDNCNMECE